MPDTWVNPKIKANSVVYDEDRKEFLMVTNGKCVLNHSSPKAYAKDHTEKQGCQYRPSEAIALRIVGEMKGRPIYGWTYVTVGENAFLKPAPNCEEWFMRAFKNKQTRYFLGRL